MKFKESLLKMLIPVIEGFSWAFIVLNLLNINGVKFWMVFFVGIFILSIINVTLIYPKIFKEEGKCQD